MKIPNHVRPAGGRSCRRGRHWQWTAGINDARCRQEQQQQPSWRHSVRCMIPRIRHITELVINLRPTRPATSAQAVFDRRHHVRLSEWDQKSAYTGDVTHCET